jgi:hypothetical protein
MLNAGLVQFSRRGPEPASCFLAWLIRIKAFGMISGRFLSYRAGSLVLLRLAGCPRLLGTPEHPVSTKRSPLVGGLFHFWSETEAPRPIDGNEFTGFQPRARDVVALRIRKFVPAL